MRSPIEQLGVYLRLARASEQRQRLLVRDRLLVIAAAVAADMELPLIAAFCRQRVLEHNPGHMLGRWPGLAAALQQEDFLSLLRQLVRRYPFETAERLLDNLGIEMAGERQAYYSDLEYAASLLGQTIESLERAVSRSENTTNGGSEQRGSENGDSENGED